MITYLQFFAQGCVELRTDLRLLPFSMCAM